MVALVYPAHFPPTSRWKKFFIGIRWLGPDLRFFETLKAEQAKRDPQCMLAWGGGKREELASAVSVELATQLRWKNPYFIPEDRVGVIFRGPSFDFSEPEDALAAVTEMLEAKFRLTVPASFWASYWSRTFGEAIDALRFCSSRVA